MKARIRFYPHRIRDAGRGVVFQGVWGELVVVGGGGGDEYVICAEHGLASATLDTKRIVGP